jgi:hypothetical protein
MVAVFSDSQATIRQSVHPELGPVQRLVRRIKRRAQKLRAHSIATEFHSVPSHSCIPKNEEVDHKARLAPDAGGSKVIERPYTSASNGARPISEARSAAKAKWEADKCSKLQSPQLTTQGQSRDQETCSDDKHEVAGYHVLPIKVRACTDRSLPKTVRPPRG